MPVDPVTGDVTGNCYRPSLFPDETVAVELSIRDEVLQVGGGEFVETKDSYCYTNEKGSVCTALPPEEPISDDDRVVTDPTLEEGSESENVATLSGAENAEVSR